MLAPFHETLYTYTHLAEHRWIESLTRDAEGLQAAKRTSIAVLYPKDLQGERTELLSRMGMLPVVGEAIERGRRMIEELKKIDERQAAESQMPDPAGAPHGND